MKQLVDWQIEQGTDVILPMGTTGEASTLTVDEHHHVIELVVDHVAGRRPVICGGGNNATSDAVAMTQFAEAAGADGVLSVGPYYNKPTQEGFYQHFKAIAGSTELPIILYNVPGRTGSNISAETTIRLSQIENIVGVKEASGDLSQISHIIAGRTDGFLVLSGDDALTLPLLSLGSDGAISVVANQTPKLFHEMVHAAFSGNWEEAREIHFRLMPLMEANFIESNPIPVKAGLALMGKLDDNFRLPLVKISEVNREKLRFILAELGLL
jgi:4-hydroxy-tetrahydrodipicolinate synthase